MVELDGFVSIVKEYPPDNYINNADQYCSYLVRPPKKMRRFDYINLKIKNY
jgi:hypothetical protein